MTPKEAPITMIETTDALASFCSSLSAETYITVDTEFLRETTYYPKLCLIQIAGASSAALIDPLAKGLSLAPFFELMANESVLKVFHAARQDIEIILKLANLVPKPVFDTQIAAMVCGFGDQVGYEAIVRKLVGAQIDKSSQFTDWARRPLTSKQMAYALSDVTHLRTVYDKLISEITRKNRLAWLDQDLATLANPDSYRIDPSETWRRIKARIQSKKQQATLMAVAAWREREAQAKDVPRGRILKDEAVAEIAIQVPMTREALHQLRLLPRGSADSSIGAGILAAVEEGMKMDPSTVPSPKDRSSELNSSQEATVEILKLALKIVCDTHGIAPKILANVSDIEAIAVDDAADVDAMNGWRREVFGNAALDLKHGRAVIGIEKGRVALLKR
jgi:ribonuclease D